MKRWELPEGWVWTTVGEVGDVRLGRQRTPEHHNGPNMRPYLRVANVMEGCIDTSDVMQMNFTDAEFKTFQLRNGDVLLNEGQTKALVGRPAIFRGEVPGACFQNTLIRFRAHEGVMPEYAFQLFRHYMHAGHFSEIAQITTSIAHLGGDRFAMRPFPLPPLPEQQRIVDRLNALQARIQRARADLAELRELAAALKRSALDAAFRGELTAAWRAEHPDVEPAEALLERLRVERRRRWEAAHPKKTYVPPKPIDPDGLPELPEGWCWARLAELVEGIGAGRSPASQGRPISAGEFGVIKVSAVTWEEFNPSENKAMFPDDMPDPEDTIKAGDLLITRANTRDLVGAVVLVKRDYPNLMLSDKTLRLRYFPEIESEFLLFGLRTRTARSAFEDESTGNSMSMLNITQQQILSAPIPLAPLTEQRRIAGLIDSAWRGANQILDTTHVIGNDLTTTEHALLNAAFHGDLVAQNPNDEPAGALIARLRAQAVIEEPSRKRR